MGAREFVTMECKFGNANYSKGQFGPDPVRFRNGRATVTKEVFELMKADRRYGTEFGQLGTLRNPATFVPTRVIRGESSVVNADDSIRAQEAAHAAVTKPPK